MNKSLRYQFAAVAIGLLVAAMGLISSPALAVLTIEVNKGTKAGIPIAIVPFEFQGVNSEEQQPPMLFSLI